MGCPFGCRQAHGKRGSTRRSVEYYRTAEGRYKRKIQNGKRRRQGKAPDAGEEADSGEDELPAGVVAHVRMVARLIEGRQVSLAEVVVMLRRVMRQRRLGGRRGIDYIVVRLKQAPP